MEFHKNYVCEEDQHAKPFQKLWYIKCYGWSSPRKTLAILSDITVRRSAVDPEDLKPYWKIEKGHISQGNHQFYCFKFFKDFTNYRKKTGNF